MNPKSIERALDRYRAFKDEDVRRRLAIFGPLILEAAAISNELDDEDVVVEREPTADETIAASKPNGTPLLRAGFVRINADSFCRCAKHLGSVLLKSLELDEKLGSAAQHFDYAPYCTEALVRTASENPHGYLEAVVKLWDSGDADEALLDIFVLPVLGETLRAYLTRFAEKASGLLERSEEQKPSYSRTNTCFCCGSEPDIAAVVETTLRGNVKKLFCSTCGASWLYERIRCVRCGNDVVSELTYISDEADDMHRMHVCSKCGGAMPTLFAMGDELTFSADIEAIVLTGLEEAYDAAVREGTVPKPILKPVDSTQVGRAPGRQN